MCEPTTLMIAAAAMTAGSQIYGGMAANAQGKAQQEVAQRNIALERNRIVDARNRNSIDITQRYRDASQRVGRMRADQAGLGLDTEFGSIFDNQMSTLRVANEDVATMGRNLTKEVQGYDININNFAAQGAAARAQGKAAMVGGFMDAAGTILGSAQQVRGYNANYTQGRKTDKSQAKSTKWFTPEYRG